TGAAALAAYGALRAGAGLVYLGVPASINDILEVKCTEAITVPLPETTAGTLSPEAADAIIEWADKTDVVAIGPGLSRHPETAKLVQQIVPRVDCPLVLDADALNCLADTTPTSIADRRSPTIITPHPGELSRLTGLDVEAIQNDRLGVARRTASDFRAITVLKGAGTIVAEPGGRAWVIQWATDALATGGTGDVLTGMIAAFIAGGDFFFDRVACAAHVHGKAGQLAAESAGDPAAVVAGDLLGFIGRALSEEDG
ncbi:MAG: NAD(P)H-hydrate dehydratase, partial [Armatimonadetes bacterium]|nr:NAD(P)H-hydrate dehydratase [Armatimonadota bacterium]